MEKEFLGSSASSSGTDTPAKPLDQPAELLPVNYDIFAVGIYQRYALSGVCGCEWTTLQMEIDTGSALTLKTLAPGWSSPAGGDVSLPQDVQWGGTGGDRESFGKGWLWRAGSGGTGVGCG